MKKKVLFLCTGNSCRSQMAEGFTRKYLAESYEAYSAGIEPSGLNPLTVTVMAEAGIDISEQQSEHLDDFDDVGFDFVVTLCGDVRDSCPVYPDETELVHMGFDDPAQAEGTEEEIISEFRRVRDEINERILPFLKGRLV